MHKHNAKSAGGPSTSDKENSMCKFVEDLSDDAGFLTVDLTRKTNPFKTPQQTPIELRKTTFLSLANLRKRPAIDDPGQQGPSSTSKVAKPAGKFTYLPAIRSVEPPKLATPNRAVATTSATSNPPPKPDPIRDLTLLTGNVEFVIKMNKLHPNNNALYEVYARILRIGKGKVQCEHSILLRNETGPVLQGVFYEIDAPMPDVASGMDVCCVGRFVGNSRLHLFKIKPINVKVKEESLARLKTLCAFTMNKKNPDK